MNNTTLGSLSRSNSFLQMDELRSRIPSAFASVAHSRTSDRYSFVPTESVISLLGEEGWLPVTAQQCKVRPNKDGSASNRNGFQKHMIRFAHRDLMAEKNRPELVLMNSHDRSCAYQLHAGIFRMVCCNGLVVCDGTFNKISVTHLNFEPSKIIEASVEICKEVPRLQANIAEMQSIHLEPSEALAFAEAAAIAKYGDLAKCPVKAERLLSPQRVADTKHDLYTILNVVQEHIIKGNDKPGWSERLEARRQGKRIGKTRAVNGIDGNVNLNKALWHLAEAVKKSKTA